MPNISFEERQGASLTRRILAAVWILIALAGAVALVNFTPKLYQGRMEICYNEGNSREVLSHTESTLKESGIPDLSIESADKEKLVITSTRDTKQLVSSSLLLLKNQIQESIRTDIESKYNNTYAVYEKELNNLNKRMNVLNENSREEEEAFSLITELKEAVKAHTMLPAGWEVMFDDNPRYKSILNELVTSIATIEEINLELQTAASRMLVLSEWFNAPENQVVQISEKRVVHYEDTPELIRLKDQKAAVEASRMRLLKRATTKHPAVIRMSGEIDELQAQINALTRSPHVVEDIREVTNPRLAEVNSKIVETRSSVAALNSRLDTITAKTAEQ